MDIYEYFNSKTIEQYWQDKHIEPTICDMLRIVYASNKTWVEKRSALLEIIKEREQEPFPEKLKEWIENKIEWYSEMETKQKELIFLKTRDTSSISAYVRQFIERMDEIERMKEKDGEGGLSSESFHMFYDRYGDMMFFFLPITKNMQKHPFEKGDILLDNNYTAKNYYGFRVVANEDEVYRIESDRGTVELTSDWNPWDCERVRTSYWQQTTDDFGDCPNTLMLISDYLDDRADWNLADLLNDWNWALEQDFPKKKNGDALSEE